MPQAFCRSLGIIEKNIFNEIPNQKNKDFKVRDIFGDQKSAGLQTKFGFAKPSLVSKRKPK